MTIKGDSRLVALVVAGGLLFGAGGASGAEFAGSDKVDAALLAEMEAEGRASYLIELAEQADLAAAPDIADHDERGWYVYRRLREVADRTQARLLAHLDALARNGAVSEVHSFFSVNGIGVTSTMSALQSVAGYPEVGRIRALPAVGIPEPQPGVELPSVNAVEWNIDKVGAPGVWEEGVLGQGIVVANIDTGVQHDHPALVEQYRGNTGSGFDHNYNWWDPSSICGLPSNVPCDNNGHGTHTMGTMVGDDGGTNQIGVAPQAQWMSCKGCESGTCSGFALLECGDFMVAPWDLNGLNPDPTKRPHLVNNSWGGGSGNTWYLGVVQSWRAAGIFPSFINHNFGPGCGSVASPGDYAESFSSGATDINDVIASFSGRGPSVLGPTKPDVSAPGVNVRSSVPPNTYASFNGTSMAGPHTSGIVALVWSRYAVLERDIANTENKLRPATVILNTSQGCGGDGPREHPNNVYGEGRMDALKAHRQFNVYPNQSVYSKGAGDPVDVQVSLVNPDGVAKTVDAWVAVEVPNGTVVYYPAFDTTPAPAEPSLLVPSTLAAFDVPLTTPPLNGAPTGSFRWFSVLTVPGGDPTNPADRDSLLDVGPMEIVP